MARRKEYMPIENGQKHYHDHYDLRRVKSWILNAGVRSYQAENAWKLQTKESAQSVLRELTGDSEEIGKIGEIEKKLSTIEQDFEIYCKKQENNGYERPTKMPDYMEEKKLELEAAYDVMQEEKAYLKKQIAKFDDQESNNRINHLMLVRGLRAVGNIDAPIGIAMIDGQLLGLAEDGIKVIADKDSPYYGMDLKDYRRMAKEWQEERKKQLGKERIKINEARKAKGLTPISVSISRNVSKSELPKFPDWAVNHFKKEDVKELEIKNFKC